MIIQIIINKGDIKKGINGYKYFYFELEKQADFTKDPNPFLGIADWKIRDQKEIGKKRRKIRWFDKVSYFHEPNDKMIINKFKFFSLMSSVSLTKIRFV